MKDDMPVELSSEGTAHDEQNQEIEVYDPHDPFTIPSVPREINLDLFSTDDDEE